MRLPFAAFVLAGSVATAVGQDMIGVVWTGEVVHIDTRTMTTRTIGMGPMGQNALAVDGAGTIWSTSSLFGGSNAHLTTINPVTGAATIVYPTPDIRDLAGNGTAMLWASVFTSATTPNQLVRIDTTNGSITTIATLPFGRVQGLTFHQGVLYGWDLTQGLLIIDPVTGAVSTRLSAPHVGVDGQYLASYPDGRLLVGRDTLFRIDLTNGSVTQIGSLGLDLRGLGMLGDWTPIGQPCGDAVGPASLFVGGVVRIGQPVTMTSINHATGTIGAEIFGFSTTSYAGQPLPLLLDPILGTSGCALYTSIDASLLGTTPSFAPANLAFTFVLPPGTAGMQFTVQHMAFAPVPGFMSWSNALTIRSR